MKVKVLGWALLSALLSQGTAAHAQAEVPGVYDGVHPHWRDSVHIFADGKYRRGNGDAGRWKAEGSILVLDWTNWGLVIMEQVEPGKYRARADGFTITKRGGATTSPTTPPPPPAQKPAPRDCGTGLDDPGCSTNREGRAPMDKTEFDGMIAALSATSNELTRLEMAQEILAENFVTARQFGKVIALFVNELNRLSLVRDRADRMVDPKRALGFSSTFNNSLNGKEYIEIVSKLR
jgi:hypothetical protein